MVSDTSKRRRRRRRHAHLTRFPQGGHFDQGSGEGPFYSGLSSASPHDTVVVTINYRLGALGFLRNDDAGIGGNFGFFDQIFALEWVQRNIRSFGGDPAKVTIYGQ